MKYRVVTLVAAGALLAFVGNSTAMAGAKTPSRSARAAGSGAIVVPKHIGATLYDQNDDPNGVSISSQNFESAFDAFDDQAADDFVVPTGARWLVKQVIVTGTYDGFSGIADSENVYFYRDSGGLPGTLVASFLGVVGTDNAGSFVIPVRAKLRAGHYWVSVQINMDFGIGGQWYWTSRNTQANSPAAWQNPGDGFGTGCSTWNTMTTCIAAGEGPDLMFALHGASR